MRARGCGQPGRAEILSVWTAFEEVARIQRDAEGFCGDAAGSVRRQSRHLCLVQECALVEPSGKQHQVPYRHPFAIGELSALTNGSVDGYVPRWPEFGDGE